MSDQAIYAPTTENAHDPDGSKSRAPLSGSRAGDLPNGHWRDPAGTLAIDVSIEPGDATMAICFDLAAGPKESCCRSKSDR